MKKLLTLLTFCFLGSNMLFSQEVIYKNTFAGDAETSPAATTPEINEIPDFEHSANAGLVLDGDGNITFVEGYSGAASYKFRLDYTPLNQDVSLTGIKATVVMRGPSNGWLSIGFGDYNDIMSPTAVGSRNTWMLVSAEAIQVFGGEGTANATFVVGTHAVNDTVTVEFIYRFDKKRTILMNGVPIREDEDVIHTPEGQDPSILWFMLAMSNQHQTADAAKRGLYSEVTIETLTSGMVTRHIDLSVDQTGWEDCITTVINDRARARSEQEIHVFPNPSDGLIEMNIGGFTSGQSLTLKVVDSQGRIIQTRDERLWGEGLHNFRIDLSGLSAGIYYIIMMDCKNKVYSCKIIKY